MGGDAMGATMSAFLPASIMPQRVFGDSANGGRPSAVSVAIVCFVVLLLVLMFEIIKERWINIEFCV